MQWIAILAITSVVYASTAMSAAALSCQPDLYGGCGDSSNSYCCDVGYCQPWNSGYYQCIDKPAKCPKQETDTDYYGNDIKAIYGIQPAQCCDECDKTPNCKAYTFVNQNPDGRTACYLKTSDAGRVGKKGAVSGALVDTPPPANCPTQEKGIDYFGNDIKTLFGGSETDCCDKCGTTTNCVAYTYIAQTSACYLKSSTAGRVAKAGAVSGKYKSGPPVSCPTQEIDFDYYGNDLKKVSGVTNDECCNACATTADCAAYTYIASDSACYLKTSDAGKVAKVGAVSGKYKVAPPTNCPTQEIDYDYFGNDLKKLTSVTNGQCCDACSTTSGCAAYTYIASQSTCYLKKSSAGKVAKIGAVSGELTCPNVVMGQCGTSTTGALCCPAGSYCQPWNPGFYQCTPVPDVTKCPSVESDVDFFGGDLEVQYGLLPGGCCDACYNNADCKMYTFINYTPSGKSACYLKNKLVEKRAKTGAISGYKV